MFNPWQDLGTVQSELMQAAARQGPGDPHGCMMSGSGAGIRGRGQGCRFRTEMIGSLTNGLPVPTPRNLLSHLVVGETWISRFPPEIPHDIVSHRSYLYVFRVALISAFLPELVIFVNLQYWQMWAISAAFT